jgi:hypothetical protein
MELTYYPEVECVVVVPEGAADTKVIYVADEDAQKHYLRVGKSGTASHSGKTYLPIGIVVMDYKGERALVELPTEPDSGVRRIWVPFSNFRPAQE